MQHCVMHRSEKKLKERMSKFNLTGLVQWMRGVSKLDLILAFVSNSFNDLHLGKKTI